MKLAIIGSRDFNNYDFLHDKMDFIAGTYKWNIELVISGGAKGADSLGEQWAKKHAILTKIYYPDWDRYGRSAGFIRNYNIIEDANVVVAFWDGKSKGTKHSIDLAKKQGKEIIIINYKEELQ